MERKSTTSENLPTTTLVREPSDQEDLRQNPFGAPILLKNNSSGHPLWEFLIPRIGGMWHCSHCNHVFQLYRHMLVHFLEEHVRVSSTNGTRNNRAEATPWGTPPSGSPRGDRRRQMPRGMRTPPAALKIGVTPNMVHHSALPVADCQCAERGQWQPRHWRRLHHQLRRLERERRLREEEEESWGDVQGELETLNQFSSEGSAETESPSADSAGSLVIVPTKISEAQEEPKKKDQQDQDSSRC